MKPGSLTFLNWDSAHIPEILAEIYLQRLYYPYLLPRQDGIFLDIGFNIGLWSFYATKYAKQIYAFEPAKEIYELGKKNMEQNGIKNVEVINAAISEKDGEATFYHSSNDTMYSLSDRINDNKVSETVKTVALDTFVKEKNIDKIAFAKIDIEGAEDRLFASDSFANVAPILDCFIYEWHTWGNSNHVTINKGLEQFGYHIRQLPSQATIFVCEKQ